MLAVLSLLAQSTQDESNPDGGSAALVIILTLVVAVIVIGGVWTFVAKRGSRVPGKNPDRERP